MATSTPLYGFFTCRKSATWNRRLYFPSEGRHAEDSFALKNPTASARFESANFFLYIFVRIVYFVVLVLNEGRHAVDFS
jgi:hypothetical protein